MLLLGQALIFIFIFSHWFHLLHLHCSHKDFCSSAAHSPHLSEKHTVWAVSSPAALLPWHRPLWNTGTAWWEQGRQAQPSTPASLRAAVPMTLGWRSWAVLQPTPGHCGFQHYRRQWHLGAIRVCGLCSEAVQAHPGCCWQTPLSAKKRHACLDGSAVVPEDWLTVVSRHAPGAYACGKWPFSVLSTPTPAAPV